MAFATAVVAVLAPVLTAVWFVGGLPMDLRKAPAIAVPAFVAADAESPVAPRTLVIDDTASGRITYTLVNGASAMLWLTPRPARRPRRGRPSTRTWRPMASGRGGDEIDALAGYGIRYVLLAKGSSQDLIPTLDGEPGLRRLSTAGGEVLAGGRHHVAGPPRRR